MWAWLVGSRLGRIVAAIGAVAFALLMARRSGRKDAEAAQERANLEEYRDARKTADDAARAADGDTRPVDDRLREQGALRD